MKSDRVFARLAYTWWVYILSAVIFIGCWIWIFDYISQPQDNEKLLISFVGAGFDDKAFEEDLKEKLPELSGQNIKNVTVESLIYDSDYQLSNTLFARSLDADIIIFGDGYVIEGMGDYYFRPIDKALYTEIFGEVAFYTENGAAYGIMLYDGETENNFSNYYEVDNKCWLFFTYNSPNTGGLNGIGEATDDSALKIVKWLLS